MRDSTGSSVKRPGQYLWDLSGAFGDVGVFLPIAIALIGRNGMNPTATFVAAGIFYILSARYFRITMPVQPLKAMSAIAIAAGLSASVMHAAGLAIGIILLLLALSGLSVRIGLLFPTPVVRGIQLGLGLMLMKASFGIMREDLAIAAGAGALLAVALIAARKVPPLIPVLVIGVALAVERVGEVSFGPAAVSPSLPDGDTLWTGLTVLVLPQIALTFGNAIVATEATAKLLYGEKARRLTLGSIPVSMGLANIGSSLMGGAPMCHGSGGLTAHAKFGATSEQAGYIIGFAFVALGLVFGQSALAVISAFPSSILGILLCYVGLQHACFVRDIVSDRQGVAIAAAIAAVALITGNLTVGFAAGIAAHYVSIGSSRVLKYVRTNL